MVHDPLRTSHSEFDAKVKTSKGTTGRKKIKILLEAHDIWKKIGTTGKD